jgi:hypothetical protein
MARNLLCLYLALPLIAPHDHELSQKQANRYLYSFGLVRYCWPCLMPV